MYSYAIICFLLSVYSNLISSTQAVEHTLMTFETENLHIGSKVEQ